MLNINTEKYWQSRFSSRDWALKGGHEQTKQFAQAQVKHMLMPRSFSGKIVDFGCGAGDAIPIYRRHFPNAKLVGVDFADSAIDICKQRYGDIASFIVGNHHLVPHTDVIVASNVFEHLDADREICGYLRQKCSSLYVTVPYRESISAGGEHVNSYDAAYFQGIGSYDHVIFPCRGWSEHGAKRLYYEIYLKNVFRFLLGKRLRERQMQIMFRFTG